VERGALRHMKMVRPEMHENWMCRTNSRVGIGVGFLFLFFDPDADSDPDPEVIRFL
jgi:hypothetical protein